MKSKKLTKLMKIQAVVFAAVFAAGACSVGAFAYNCSRVRSDVLRMHVIANSDCSADQQLKLMVRDAVLERGAQLFDGTVTADEARRKIEPHKAELEAAARDVIERAGYDYPVSVNVVNEYFATRCYGSLTMPAGRYTAVKVVIGEGAGHNWWCVMFPPLCLPAAQDRGGNLDAFFDDGELKVVESSGRYEPRFKIVEIIEKLKEKTSFEN
mgnify:FL=1